MGLWFMEHLDCSKSTYNTTHLCWVMPNFKPRKWHLEAKNSVRWPHFSKILSFSFIFLNFLEFIYFIGRFIYFLLSFPGFGHIKANVWRFGFYPIILDFCILSSPFLENWNLRFAASSTILITYIHSKKVHFIFVITYYSFIVPCKH